MCGLFDRLTFLPINALVIRYERRTASRQSRGLHLSSMIMPKGVPVADIVSGGASSLLSAAKGHVSELLSRQLLKCPTAVDNTRGAYCRGKGAIQINAMEVYLYGGEEGERGTRRRVKRTAEVSPSCTQRTGQLVP